MGAVGQGGPARRVGALVPAHGSPGSLWLLTPQPPGGLGTGASLDSAAPCKHLLWFHTFFSRVRGGEKEPGLPSAFHPGDKGQLQHGGPGTGEGVQSPSPRRPGASEPAASYSILTVRNSSRTPGSIWTVPPDPRLTSLHQELGGAVDRDGGFPTRVWGNRWTQTR